MATEGSLTGDDLAKRIASQLGRSDSASVRESTKAIKDYLNYLVKNQGSLPREARLEVIYEAPKSGTGVRLRRRYSESDVAKVDYLWRQHQLGISTKEAANALAGGLVTLRAYMAFHVPASALARVVDSLKSWSSLITSYCSFYGSMNLMIELAIPPMDSAGQDVAELRRAVLRTDPGVSVWTDLDLASVEAAQDQLQPILWRRYPETVFARILLRVGSEGVLRTFQQLGTQHAGSGGIVNIDVDRLDANWNVMLSVTSDSVDSLADFVTNKLKLHRAITRSATFVALPRNYWHRSMGEPATTSDAKLKAYAFIQTQGMNDDLAIDHIKEHYGHLVKGVTRVWGEYDLVAELEGDQQDLEHFVLDVVGGNLNVVDIATAIVIPRVDSAGGPNAGTVDFPPPETSRIGYCIIYSPNLSNEQVIGRISKIKDKGIAKVFGTLGMPDGVVTLGPGSDAPRTVKEIQKVIGSGMVVTYIAQPEG